MAKNQIDLRRVDLNLLLVFDVLHRTRSTTRAASQLHLTQPAVSNALRRLRDQFDDILFVKTPGGMQPTPRADAIARHLDEGFAALRLAVNAGEPFDPATATRTFHLHLSDIGQTVFIPPLAARLKTVAPHLHVSTHYAPLETARQRMKLGELDLAIGNFTGFQSDFVQQKLFDESYVVLVRAEHPEIGSTLSIDQFFAVKHIDYAPTAGSHAEFEDMLRSLSTKVGKDRHVALRLAHAFGIDRIVASCDLIACVPSHVADALINAGDVRAVPFPVDVPTVDISQVWHERCHRDEGHQWLRSLVYDIFSDRRSSPFI